MVSGQARFFGHFNDPAVVGSWGAEICCQRGNALMSMRRYREALQYFEQAFAMDSTELQLDVLVDRAVCLLHLERFSEALLCCDRILAAAPDHPQAWLFRGVAHQRLGCHRQAYADYRRAVGKPPRFPLFHPVRRLRDGIAWVCRKIT